MPPINISKVEENPVQYWRSNKEVIQRQVANGDEASLQRASYAFVKAAKQGQIGGVTPEFAATLQNRIGGQDSTVQTNVVGGIAAILIQADIKRVRMLFESNLVRQVAKAGDDDNAELGLNSMISLSMLSLHWPGLVGSKHTIQSGVRHVTLDRTSVERTKATYASMMLANICHHHPNAITGGVNTLRKSIDLSVDDRQFAALAYCLQQSFKPESSTEEEHESIRDSLIADLGSMLKFANDTNRVPRHRAIVLESMIPICERWPSQIQKGPIKSSAENILNNTKEATMVFIAAKNLLESLPDESAEIDSSIKEKLASDILDQFINGEKMISPMVITDSTFRFITNSDRVITGSPDAEIR